MHPPPGQGEVGYKEGVEVDAKTTLLGRFKSLCARHNLKVITMVFTDGPVAPGEGIVFGGRVLIIGSILSKYLTRRSLPWLHRSQSAWGN